MCIRDRLVLSGDADPEDMQLQLMRNLEELSQVFSDQDSERFLGMATSALVAGDHYRCLKALRGLIPREERLFAAQV